MGRMRRIIEYIKTVLIAILIVSAVCLFIAYMFEFQSISENSSIVFERMKVLSGAAGTASYDISSDCIFPAAFAYSCDGGRYAFTGSRSLYYTAYTEALNYLGVMYSSSSYCVKLGEDAAAVWDGLTDRDFVYLLYQKPLPLPVLRLFSGYSGNTADVVQGELPYVREVFVTTGDAYLASEFSKASGIAVSPASGDICAAVRDAEGSVYLIFCVSSHSDVKFDKALFSAYNENDSVCAFLKDSEGYRDGGAVYGVFSDTVMIPAQINFLPDIRLSRYAPESFSEATVTGFLNDIGINTAKIRHYERVDGGGTYISESFVFSISADGVITYRAVGDTGIPLSEILGYSKASGSYSLFDSLTAVSGFISCATTGFGQSFFGGNLLSALMTKCDYADGELTIEYLYGYNGIKLTGEECITVTVKNGSITYAELHTVSASQGEGKTKLEPAFWAINSALYGGAFDGGKTLYGLNISYVPKDGVCKAEWEVTVK